MQQTLSPTTQWRDRLVRSPLPAVLLALLSGGLVGTAVAFGPIYAIAGLLALAAVALVLVSVEAGLITVFAIATLIPFGTLPFKAIITPNFLTLALLGLSVVWVLRLLARSDRYELRLSPLGLPLLGFLGLTLFSLVLGAGGLPDTQTLHNYAKFVLAVLLFFSVINTVNSDTQARIALRGLLICGALAALTALGLLVLNDALALQVLVALARIGYPSGGRVLRYVEDDPDGLERAIGLSVDPNSFGGMLALVTVFGAAQLMAQRPILHRGVLACIVGVSALAVLLTFSRAALFGLIIAAAYLATVRYRRLWGLMIAAALLGAVLLFGLGIADDFTDRVVSGVQFEDQAQQMRLAEYENALAIIQRYPLFGIGFGQAPDIDLTAGVSSIYLAIGQRMGLVGLGAFLVLVAAWFVITLQRLPLLNDERASWLLGAQAAIVAALAVGLADHYFFNIEFSHMVALFWGTIGLGTAISLLPAEDAPAHTQTSAFRT